MKNEQQQQEQQETKPQTQSCGAGYISRNDPELFNYLTRDIN